MNLIYFKNSSRKILLLLLAGILYIAAPEKLQAQDSSVTQQYFYEQLSPYGQWVYYQPYGYVWLPNAGPTFAPYCSSGHWVWTEYGWTWVSDYAWGWIPFHYGRWDYISCYGWIWVPGTVWGPAWVVWSSSPEYYGWAPLWPGADIVVTRRYHRYHNRWIFVRHEYISHPDIYRYYQPRGGNSRTLRHSSLIPNTRNDNSRNSTYVTGPDRNDVQRNTGAPVQQYSVRDMRSPGQYIERNDMNIYRPRVQRDANPNAAPSRVVNLRTVTPASRRPYTPNQTVQPGRMRQPMPPENNQRRDNVNPDGRQPQVQPRNVPQRQPEPQQPRNIPERRPQPQRPQNIPQQRPNVPNAPQRVPQQPRQMPQIPQRPPARYPSPRPQQNAPTRPRR